MLDNTTIIVRGARRPIELSNTLESLRRQGVQSIAEQTAECERVANHYKPADLFTHRGRIGIDKMMMDARSGIRDGAAIVLEDDCFRRSKSFFSHCGP